MKKILSTIMLAFTLSLFSGIASAQDSDSTIQIIDSTTYVIRTCYNSTLKVITKKGENKEKKVRLKNNCFELAPQSLTLTNSKDKTTIYSILGYEMKVNSTGVAYLLYVTDEKGKVFDIIVHSELKYVGIHNPDTGRTDWYFTRL